ncbi:MAG: hypothetical protein JXB32_11130 [Deltaproteobacteria bacterium]|nr:hypothetical protein [Deltaproteobacteria bacterium]
MCRCPARASPRNTIRQEPRSDKGRDPEPQDYWAEPHGVPSPSATRILFGGDWGGGDGVDACVAELPGYVAP